METKYYIVARIDGDYAWLARTDKEEEPLLVARALLPEAIDEGTKLNESMEWAIVQSPENYASDYSTVTERETEFHIIALDGGEGAMEFQCTLGDGTVEQYELTLSISRHQKKYLQIDSVSFVRVSD